MLLLVGASGVLVGLVWAPVGIAAGACLTGYFLLAIGAHIRHRDLARVGPPIALTLFSVAALVLRTPRGRDTGSFDGPRAGTPARAVDPRCPTGQHGPRAAITPLTAPSR